MTLQQKRTGRKNGNGEGNIRLRADGRYEARVSLPGGKSKSFYGKTRADVRRAMTAALGDVQSGITVPTGRLTVNQFLDSWLEDVVRVKNKIKTLESYRGIVRTHIAPGLGSRALARLTPQDVQRFLTEKGKTASPSMVKHIRDVLRIALSQAVRWRMIAHNPAAATESPRVEQREIRALSLDEARGILAAFKGNRYEMPVTLALCLGLRRGEVLGLRWVDVDLDAATLTVRHQVQFIAREWQFVEPKSKESRRTLPLPTFLVEALRAHRTRQLEQRLAVGPVWHDYDLVCPTEVGTPQHGLNLTHRFQARLKAVGLPPMRFHDLRHGAATVLLAQGASIKEIQVILGHSDYKSTLVYSHIVPELMRQNADRMQAAFG